MNLTFDATEIRTKLADPLRASPRRLRATAAIALTRTAGDVKEAERREMLDVFDRPTPYTLNSLFVKPADALSDTKPPEALVGIKNDFGGSRSPLNWLRWNIRGGQRTLTAWEKALVRGGAMNSDQRAVPGKFARLDSYGNLSRGQIIQILSQLRIGTGLLGSERRLPAAVPKTSADFKLVNRKIQSAYRRAGGQYIALPNGRGNLKPGIYQVRRFGHGSSDPRPVVRFVSHASYEAERFDFYYVADITIRRRLGLHLSGRLAQSLLQRDAATGQKVALA